ncbi:MAG: hypothetical protein K2M45_01225 [Muribaculaceae bacterium]|nr:hypothetical protein [Muribaculaceae bacterium]MDE6236471.1 hypothetical protein [Muribaculaceae bacterium]
MGKAKGSKKSGGRKKGTPNKVSGTLREFISALIDESRDSIKEDLQALQPRERLAFLEKMMKFVLPTPKDTPTEEAVNFHNVRKIITFGGFDDDLWGENEPRN